MAHLRDDAKSLRTKKKCGAFALVKRTRSLIDSVEKLNAFKRMTLHVSAVCLCNRSKSV
jgi:hypothetical protein